MIFFVLCTLWSPSLTHAEMVEIVTPESYHNQGNKTESNQHTKPDSYLEALRASQKAHNRLDDEHYPSQPADYLPIEEYHLYSHNHKAPLIYGPPIHVDHSYPPATTMSIKGPSASSMLMSLVPKSIDIQTVFKLLLKLMLFKIIVKFVGVVCLMLVWPLFNNRKDDEERQMEALGELTELVWSNVFPQTTGQGEEDAEGLVEKVAGHIDEKMTIPSEEAAIGFLEFCVSAANAVVGWMMGFLRRRRNEVDPLEETVWTAWEKAKTM